MKKKTIREKRQGVVDKGQAPMTDKEITKAIAQLKLIAKRKRHGFILIIDVEDTADGKKEKINGVLFGHHVDKTVPLAMMVKALNLSPFDVMMTLSNQ